MIEKTFVLRKKYLMHNFFKPQAFQAKTLFGFGRKEKVMQPTITSQSVITCGDMKMPVIGLGTWKATPRECEDSVHFALCANYRHIDTAYAYKNEVAVGNTVAMWLENERVRREDLFIVTKLPYYGNRGDDVAVYLQKSLDALQLDYVDLYLIHFPAGICKPEKGQREVTLDIFTSHMKLWKAMEEQVDECKTKHIGLSNFNINQIEKILKIARIPPACNQVEMHLYHQQEKMLQFCKEHCIALTAYAPLGSPGTFPLKATDPCGKGKKGKNKMEPLEEENPFLEYAIKQISLSKKKTPAQVLIRFLLQLGVAVIPKSIDGARIRENIKVFDFELNSCEMSELKELDKGFNGRRFNKDVWTGMECHPEYPFEDD